MRFSNFSEEWQFWTTVYMQVQQKLVSPDFIVWRKLADTKQWNQVLAQNKESTEDELQHLLLWLLPLSDSLL